MEKGPAAIVREEPTEQAPVKIVNRRHGEFNKLKSSTAMQTLLKSDEATKKKERAVKSGSQINSKSEFESRRNEGILRGQKSK